MDKFRLRFVFSLWLPICAVLLSTAIVLVPATRVYLRWKAAMGNGDGLMLTAGKFQMTIPRERMFRFAFESNAMGEQDTIFVLNAPGHLMGALASESISHEANGFPDFLGPFLWRVLSAPLFAIPAWFFVGRGIDGLLLHRRMRLFDLVLSALLVLLSIGLCVGLRFGLTESERAGDEKLMSFIYGFASWSLLFAFPLLGWVRQRLRKDAAV